RRCAGDSVDRGVPRSRRRRQGLSREARERHEVRRRRRRPREPRSQRPHRGRHAAPRRRRFPCAGARFPVAGRRHAHRPRPGSRPHRKLDMTAPVANAVAAVSFLRGRADGNGKVGAVGFCWGGGLVNQLAVHAPTLNAAVAYYGRTPDPADVSKIKSPLLLHYAGLDTRINEGVPAFRAALAAAGVPYQMYTYEGANHAFNNDTSTERYNAEAAKLAWERTLAFLAEKLKA